MRSEDVGLTGDQAKPKPGWREKWREKRRDRAERRARVDQNKVRGATRQGQNDAARWGGGGGG